METQMIPTFDFLDQAFAIAPPVITAQPQSATVAVGASFTMSVTATGLRPPKFVRKCAKEQSA
jgi:hypothetical protein